MVSLSTPYPLHFQVLLTSLHLSNTDASIARCPHLYIGQHWQDMSIPVYCYLEQTGQGPGVFSDLKWAIRPLGDPLGGKPAWTDLSAPVSTMVSQVTGVNEELKQELMNSMDAILRAKYVIFLSSKFFFQMFAKCFCSLNMF